jgi:hypothetical protein
VQAPHLEQYTEEEHVLAAGILFLATLFAGNEAWTGPTALPVEGKATYYGPGVMEWVWQYRLNLGSVPQCPDCLGPVAMMRKGDIGRKVWLQYKGQVSGPYMVVDCAGRTDFPNLTKRGLVAEVPYRLAMRWGMKGPVNVTVLDAPPQANGVSK